jgi:hypothetical protein
MDIKKAQTHHILCQVCNNLYYPMEKSAPLRYSFNR